MYENVRTCNPLAGKCPHDCVYCSTKSFRYPDQIKKYSGELRLDEKAFKKNLGKGNTWFVCAQNDLFAEGVPDELIRKIYNYIANNGYNTYWFQSKNPKRMYEWAQNPFVYGTTVETNRDYQLSKTTLPKDKSFWMSLIEDREITTYITVEPIMDFDLNEFVELLNFANPTWINIGADSKKHNLPEPNKTKILELILELKKFTEVRIKSNLERLIK
jgi:hypothetical protein